MMDSQTAAPVAERFQRSVTCDSWAQTLFLTKSDINRLLREPNGPGEDAAGQAGELLRAVYVRLPQPPPRPRRKPGYGLLPVFL